MSNPFDGAIAGAMPMALALSVCILIFGGGFFCAGGVYLVTGEVPMWAQRAGMDEDTFKRHHWISTNVWSESLGEYEQQNVWVVK